MDSTDRLKSGGTWSPHALEQAASRAQKLIELLARHHAGIPTVCNRYEGAFNIALAQYKMGPLDSKLADASKFLELTIKFGKIYHGRSSTLV
jgi:hypothetical protein